MSEHFKFIKDPTPKEVDLGMVDGRLNTAADFETKFPGFPEHFYPIMEQCQREKDERETPPPKLCRSTTGMVKKTGKFKVEF